MSHTAVRKPLEAVIDQNEGAKRENHKAVSTQERTEFLRGYGSYRGLTHHIATSSDTPVREATVPTARL